MVTTGGTSRDTGVIWSCVEKGFFVGSRDGNFLGYVEERHGYSYAAFDALSRSVGTFADLPAAMQALSGLTPRTGTPA